MIHLLIGFVAGVVAACVSHFIFGKGNTKAESEKEPMPEEARLNKEKKEREKKEREDRNAELERQFEQMMNYHGKEQKKA